MKIGRCDQFSIPIEIHAGERDAWRCSRCAAGTAEAPLTDPPPLSTLLALMALCGDAPAPLLRGLVHLTAPGAEEAGWTWLLWNHADLERLPGDVGRVRPERVTAHAACLCKLPAELVWRA